MDLTSHQVRESRFTEHDHGYDRDEVDAFRDRVERVLAEYEARLGARPAAPSIDVPTPGSRNTGRPEGRAVTGDEQDPGGGDEAAARMVAATAEAARILAAARTEGEVLVAAARKRAAAIPPEMHDEMHRIRRRLARVRTAISDIDARFRGLVSTTHEELSLLIDLIDLETAALDDIEGRRTDSPWSVEPARRVIDLTSMKQPEPGSAPQLRAIATSPATSGGPQPDGPAPHRTPRDPLRERAARRLSGLRSGRRRAE